MPKVKIPDIFAPLSLIRKPQVGIDKYAACRNGHGTHIHKTVEVSLLGEHKGIEDVPPVKNEFETNFKMNIYDWQSYFFTKDGNETYPLYEDYCPGQDIISYSIDQQGVWEAYETLLVLDILSNGNKEDVVLDFGSHIGWYSIISALKGYKVGAFDALKENIDLLEQNAKENGLQYKVFPFLSWIDDTAPMLPADKESVHFVKIDIEGLENNAFRMVEPLVTARKVNYLMIEVSPVFGDYYPDLIERIAKNGYRVFQIPGKGYDLEKQYADNPLDTVKNYCEIPESGRRKYIQSLSQENFLLIKD